MEELKLIPEEILKDRISFLRKGNMICNCGILHENIICYPYAWDSEEHEVIYASYCDNCGEMMLRQMWRTASAKRRRKQKLERKLLKEQNELIKEENELLRRQLIQLRRESNG